MVTQCSWGTIDIKRGRLIHFTGAVFYVNHLFFEDLYYCFYKIPYKYRNQYATSKESCEYFGFRNIYYFKSRHTLQVKIPIELWESLNPTVEYEITINLHFNYNQLLKFFNQIMLDKIIFESCLDNVNPETEFGLFKKTWLELKDLTLHFHKKLRETLLDDDWKVKLKLAFEDFLKNDIFNVIDNYHVKDRFRVRQNELTQFIFDDLSGMIAKRDEEDNLVLVEELDNFLIQNFMLS